MFVRFTVSSVRLTVFVMAERLQLPFLADAGNLHDAQLAELLGELTLQTQHRA